MIEWLASLLRPYDGFRIAMLAFWCTVIAILWEKIKQEEGRD